MKGCLLAALAGALFCSAPAAWAEDGWTGQLTPYVWGTGLGGRMTPFRGAPTLSFDRSFSEVLKDLDGAAFLSGYARHDRFVLLGDFSYAASSRAGHLPGGIPAEGKLTQYSLTLAAGYRVVDQQDASLDLLGGARFWRMSGRISALGGMISTSPDKEFTDPILAMRANFRLAPDWSMILYADAGGFGVGSDSTFQILATANYQMNERTYVSFGYRHLDVNYRSGGTTLDMTMAGPLLGVTWTF